MCIPKRIVVKLKLLDLLDNSYVHYHLSNSISEDLWGHVTRLEKVTRLWMLRTTTLNFISGYVANKQAYEGNYLSKNACIFTVAIYLKNVYRKFRKIFKSRCLFNHIN